MSVHSSADNDVISEMEYDPPGRKTSIDDKNRGMSTYQYNVFGQLTEQTDARGVVTTLEYDELGRKIHQNLAGTGDIESEDMHWVYGTGNTKHRMLYEYTGNWKRYTYYDYRRYNDGGFVEARGVRNHYQNNQVLKQQEAREGSAGRIYHEITLINSKGLVTGYNKGKQAITQTYDSANRLNGISSNDYIQNDQYEYDSLGNLTSRQLTTSDLQTFGYDELNRIINVDNSQRFAYHNNGSLIEKDGWVLDYSDPTKPIHAVGQRSKNGEVETYQYDAVGNQLSSSKNGATVRRLQYSARNKVLDIQAGSKTTTFSYDANNTRFKRTDTNSTVFYVGSLELTIKGSPENSDTSNDVYIKRYVGDAMQTYYPSGNALLRWFYKDHLGSVVAVTNDNGQLVKRFSYDVFGLQSEIAPSYEEQVMYYETDLLVGLTLAEVSPSTRGFTGHEPVQHANIIHMNGRIYDPTLGRFLQADPHIQAPDNSQSFNRYSYVVNNPLSYTDPSGYFFSSLFKGVRNLVKGALRAIASVPILNTIAQAAACFYGGPWGCAAYASASTYAVTGSLSSAFVSGAIAFASAHAFAEIGAHFDGLNGSGSINFGGNMLTGGQVAQQITAHALVGGVISKLQGGKFGHGFFSAGVTKGVGGAFLPGGADLSGGEIAQGTLISVVVGGTASVISGGKFANGAQTAAFQYLFNQVATAQQKPKPINRGNNATLTDDEIANSIFNETRSLSGADVDDARCLIAHTIINGDEQFGSGRPSTAPTTISNLTNKAEIATRLSIGSIVQSVRLERALGVDPTAGAVYFNFRDPNYMAQYGKTIMSPRFGLSVTHSVGPFNNSYPTQVLGPNNIYLTIVK